MKVVFNEKTDEDFNYFKRSGDKGLQKKIIQLLEAIEKDPCNGIGKPECLKDNLSGYWSRRINKEHRVIYKVLEEQKEIQIYSLKGHYEN